MSNPPRLDDVLSELAEERRQNAALRERAAVLERLDDLLGTLTGVLDIRGVFDRVSDIAHTVLPHDAMSVTTVLEAPLRVRVHAISGFRRSAEVVRDADAGSVAGHRTVGFPDHRPANRRSLRGLAEREHRHEIGARPADPVDGRLRAGVNFYSRAGNRFTRDDVLIARRIADHVALALAHHRLAEEVREADALRSRAVNLGLLDDLLATLSDSGPLSEVFERISVMAKNLLAHDAITLPVLLPDGVHARVYASNRRHASVRA